MKNKPQISVVIPAFNEEKTIASCLESLTKQKIDTPFEVILVDNNSTDKTVEAAAKFKKRLNLKIIKEKKQGRGAARAAGFNIAQGEYIFSSDADTIYPPNWLSGFLSRIKLNNAVAVTGTCKIHDCSVLTNCLFNLCQPILMHLYSLVYGYYWLSGFSFVIKKDIYERSGGFDPNLQAVEDVEIAEKVAKLGEIAYLDLPVNFSGRRFKRGILRGYFEYLRSYVGYKQKKAYLSNIR